MADSPPAELDPSAREVRDLIRRARPDLAELPLVRAAEGWDNVTWRLGDDLAIRLPRRRAAVDLIRNEQQALAVLAPALADVGVATPIPVLNGVPNRSHPYPWSLVPWLSGVSALGRPRVENTAWAPTLAEALLALHRPAPEDAPRNPVRGVPLATRDAAIRRRIDELDARVVAPLRAQWRRGVDAPRSHEKVWIHGDLHPGNILIIEGRLSALIDFGDVTGGDPAYDLAIAWLAFDESGRAAFQGRLVGRYDEPTWVRARAWAAAFAAIMLTQSDDRDDHRELGASTATELATDAQL